MLVRIPDVLSPEQLARFRAQLEAATWVDGRETAGPLAAAVKRNRQLARTDPLAARLGEELLARLNENPVFVAAALPAAVMPPTFNRYDGGEAYGTHVDNAIQVVDGGLLRADVAATVFLSNPADYDGGELVVEDTYGAHAVRLAAGEMILYAAGSRHHVAPVTRGTRLAAIFWIQSMVRDEGSRTLLFELDAAIRGAAAGDGAAVVRLSGVYQALVRRWVEP